MTPARLRGLAAAVVGVLLTGCSGSGAGFPSNLAAEPMDPQEGGGPCDVGI